MPLWHATKTRVATKPAAVASMSRPRKTNEDRVAPWKERQNLELEPGDGPDFKRCRARIRRMRGKGASAAIRWAEAMLDSPQSALYAESDLALLEFTARICQRLEAGDGTATELTEFRHLSAKLMVGYPDRLNRGRVEIKPAAGRGAKGHDQLAAKRAMKDRLAN